MKAKSIAMVLMAFTAVATTASAFASTAVAANTNGGMAQSAHEWAPVNNTPKGKTRAEVRAELLRAQKDGQLAALSELYRGG
ncbi:hypothetical protein WS99_15855 [Burkholderia territorii]|uniref:DUF4148 domain-containing protein n=1 Tax=Burkholderia territorii TaxID=1503055 RepID=UPI000755A161|nr:DUF4148 domain-containing protein [Burkholderia territorii]KVL51594.1 hypothetical protein WS99_15855 [Burkholderia territorii]